jgi:hypothetical protein
MLPYSRFMFIWRPTILWDLNLRPRNITRSKYCSGRETNARPRTSRTTLEQTEIAQRVVNDRWLAECPLQPRGSRLVQAVFLEIGRPARKGCGRVQRCSRNRCQQIVRIVDQRLNGAGIENLAVEFGAFEDPDDLFCERVALLPELLELHVDRGVG